MPSMAGTTTFAGKCPAKILSTKPTHAAISCCSKIGSDKIQIAAHILLPARRPARICPSSIASASTSATAINPSAGSSGPIADNGTFLSATAARSNCSVDFISQTAFATSCCLDSENLPARWTGPTWTRPFPREPQASQRSAAPKK